MKIEVSVPRFAGLLDDVGRGIAEAATGAMRETTPEALGELRRQTLDAGLGQRMANTWRDRVYPESRESMTPTGYIWSNAPDIADAFERGATIYPHGGKRFLWIPTENVPIARGRYTGSGRIKRVPMTPDEVEIAFDQDLIIRRGRGGRLLAFVNAVAAKNGRGFKRGTKGRLAQGRALKPILMFTLVPAVKMPKLYDLDGVAKRWSARFDTAFGNRLARL